MVGHGLERLAVPFSDVAVALAFFLDKLLYFNDVSPLFVRFDPV
jgi:hypothetical protein